ncbi:MAG: hypothetical protein AB8G05_09010 [Oligoflexales bacterium]
MKRPPNVPNVSPVWMPYMRVVSCDETNKLAEKLGGKILMPKTKIPQTDYFSLIEDPAGAHFYSFEFDM